MIYLVTSGTYSDFGIRAAFTDRAEAEKFLADIRNMIRRTR